MPAARILWTQDYDPSVVELAAVPARPDDPDGVDVMDLGFRATVIAREGREYVVLDDGYRRIRIDVLSGTVREGPVQPVFRMRGLVSIKPKLRTLGRILALARPGFRAAPHWPADQRMARWIDMLRVHDAYQGGASQREIAAALFGSARIAEDWCGGSDALQSRVRRLIKRGEAMAAGGYRWLLRAEHDPGDGQEQRVTNAS